jgi:hypothetical protein
MLITMTVKVLRVELARSTYEQMQERAGSTSIGVVIGDALREGLPALIAMGKSPLARGSQAQIAVFPALETGLAALRRSAEHTPPPARFTQVVQLAIPTELWSEIERERIRLHLSIDDVVAWAWRRRIRPSP